MPNWYYGYHYYHHCYHFYYNYHYYLYLSNGYSTAQEQVPESNLSNNKGRTKKL